MESHQSDPEAENFEVPPSHSPRTFIYLREHGFDYWEVRWVARKGNKTLKKEQLHLLRRPVSLCFSQSLLTAPASPNESHADQRPTPQTSPESLGFWSPSRIPCFFSERIRAEEALRHWGTRTPFPCIEKVRYGACLLLAKPCAGVSFRRSHSCRWTGDRSGLGRGTPGTTSSEVRVSSYGVCLLRQGRSLQLGPMAPSPP